MKIATMIQKEAVNIFSLGVSVSAGKAGAGAGLRRRNRYMSSARKGRKIKHCRPVLNNSWVKESSSTTPCWGVWAVAATQFNALMRKWGSIEAKMEPVRCTINAKMAPSRKAYNACWRFMCSIANMRALISSAFSLLSFDSREGQRRGRAILQKQRAVQQ